jgi:hypothetical protein
MIVWEQFVNCKTGETGRRQVEMPDVMTEQQAAQREAAAAPSREKDATVAQLRAQMQEALVDQAFGLDVTERMAELRAAFERLRVGEH